jgi:multidrug efflux pump subunit AcrA (membrane-fusion protein)
MKQLWNKTPMMLAVATTLTSLPACRNNKGTAATTRQIAVTKGDITQSVTVIGTLTPQRRLVVQPTFDGYIRKIFVKMGQVVKAGDPLVQISSSSNSNEISYPQRAQFEGRVVDILRQEGEWVEKIKDNPILLVDDPSVFTVDCGVPELDIAKYKVGLTAEISPIALQGQHYDGKITTVAHAAKLKDANRWGMSAVEFNVKLQILNPDDDLKSGMTASVRIIFDSAKDVPVLPHDYVDIKDGKAFVQTSTGETKAVELGISDDKSIEIKSGLSIGETVRQVDFYSEKL